MPNDETTPGLSPEEEQVRRLLADARHTEPLPDDVAARLDGVLADLRREPAHVRTDAPVDLTAVRRRRRVRTLLVAAAAVVVVGVGIDQLDLSMSADSGDSATSGTSAEHAPDGGTRDQDGSSAQSPAPPRVYRLDADRFGAAVTELRRELLGGEETLSSGPQAATSDGLLYSQRRDSAFRASCRTPALRPGRVVLVRYDGRPGSLVFRPVHGDTQVVDLVLCGADRPTRSITLPAP